MMTHLGLRTADPDHLMSTGVGFRLPAGRPSTRADDLADTRGRPDHAWTGAAANGAARCCDRLGERLRDASTAALRCDQVLYELGLLVRRARVLPDEADDLARPAGVSIGAGGRAALPMTGTPPDPGAVQACAVVNGRVDAAVDPADRADHAATDDPRELTAAFGAPAENAARDQVRLVADAATEPDGAVCRGPDSPAPRGTTAVDYSTAPDTRRDSFETATIRSPMTFRR